MLQRSPSHVLSLPSEDPVFKGLSPMIGPHRAYRVVRRKNIAIQRAIYGLSQRYPRAVRRVLMADLRRRLPNGFDVDARVSPQESVPVAA